MHERINADLIGDIGQGTQSRIDERGLRMPSWWNPEDSAGVTLEQAQATALQMRRR